MDYLNASLIGTLFASTILLAAWGHFRSWQPQGLRNCYYIAWLLGWLGYLIYDIASNMIGQYSIENHASNSFIIMIFYDSVIVYLAIRKKWPGNKICSLIVTISAVFIGYVILILSASILVSIMAMCTITPILYWLTKARMGI